MVELFLFASCCTVLDFSSWISSRKTPFFSKPATYISFCKENLVAIKDYFKLSFLEQIHSLDSLVDLE